MTTTERPTYEPKPKNTRRRRGLRGAGVALAIVGGVVGLIGFGSAIMEDLAVKPTETQAEFNNRTSTELAILTGGLATAAAGGVIYLSSNKRNGRELATKERSV